MSIQVSPVSPNAPAATPTEKRKAYLDRLLAQKPSDHQLLSNIRDRALTLIQEQELPSNKVEDWRFTDLKPVYEVDFQTAKPSEISKSQLNDLLWEGIEQRAVFINGQFSAEHSHIDSLPTGVSFQSLSNATASELQPVSQNPGANEIFTALNTASFSDIALLKVEKNAIAKDPIHLLFITVVDESHPFVTCPRIHIKVESGASASIIEEYVTVGEGPTLTNAVSEIVIGGNAELKHSRIQRESKSGFHIGKTSVTQDRDSRYHAVAIGLGGQISRHSPEVTLQGNQTETDLDGLTLSAGTQIADTHSTLAFTTSHCSANQLHKCIIDDSARAVFNGKVFVPHDAQLTDAAQLSRNLLLSPKARVDTKPQLEIVADDVKCAHGATVSQLEEDEVFYLQSRGLDRESACDLLVEAFAAEIIDKCPVASMREGLLQQVLDQVR